MLVSVLIPNYNYGRYLSHCIESVLAQTYAPVEIIVYDDGSTDHSKDILKGYGQKIKLLSNSNHGAGHTNNQIHAINQAYRHCSGDIIFLLDSDDAFHPNKIRNVVELFGQHPTAVIVETAGEHVDAQGRVLDKRVRTPPLHVAQGFLDQQHILPMTQSYQFPFAGLPTSFLAFRRSFLDQVMPLKEDQRDACFVDARLSSLAALYGGYVCSEESLTYYRVHGQNHFHDRSPMRFLKCLAQTASFYNEHAVANSQPPVRYWRGKGMRIAYGMAVAAYLYRVRTGFKRRLRPLFAR